MKRKIDKQEDKKTKQSTTHLNWQTINKDCWLYSEYDGIVFPYFTGSRPDQFKIEALDDERAGIFNG